VWGGVLKEKRKQMYLKKGRDEKKEPKKMLREGKHTVTGRGKSAEKKRTRLKKKEGKNVVNARKGRS